MISIYPITLTNQLIFMRFFNKYYLKMHINYNLKYYFLLIKKFDLNLIYFI